MRRNHIFIFSIFSLSLIAGAPFVLFNYVRMKTQPISVRFVDRYSYATLSDAWTSYRDTSIGYDGRTVDRSQNLLTTSEGQSYSLLRAVWVDDKTTFDQVLTWTKNNLQKRGTDNLFSWKWGQLPDGINWGVQVASGGNNTASDADLDIALALIMASRKWNQKYYLMEAQKILNDVWKTEVITIQGKPYLVAGDWAAKETSPSINPSYFNFAGYDIFAQVDPTHDWKGLKTTSYEILNSSTDKLPPDWLQINRTTGEITLLDINNQPSVFSNDAVRIPWRVALDWEWNKDPRALSYLNRLSALNNIWQTQGKFVTTYSLSGNPIDNNELLSTYGALLPYFMITNPKEATQFYNEKVAQAYSPDNFSFVSNTGYYSQNWGWFGMAFYQGRLIDVYRNGGGIAL